MRNLVIFGTSTTAESIYEFVVYHKLFNVVGFTVDNKEINEFKGLPVYNLSELEVKSTFNKNEDFLFVAIQWNYLNKVRRNVYKRLKSEGYKLANIISPNTLIYGEIKGDNCWISDFVIIEHSSKIGSNIYIKTKAYVAHGCIIENHCFIGANSFIAGLVKIGEQSFVGISSNIFDDLVIGKKCLVGACTIVKRNMPDFSSIKTNSENYIVKNYTEDEIESKLVSSKNIR